MKRVVLITNHYLESRHKAGFHWLAEAFWRAGWHVTFFTESLSWLSWLRGDPRCRYPVFQQAHRLRTVRERLTSYVWLTPFHPIQLRWSVLNRLSGPVLKFYSRFSLGEAKVAIAAADLFIFDSDHGLLLFDRFQDLNPQARFVYRVSDNIPMLGHHPLLPAHEERIAPRFDLISVPAAYIQRRFANLPQVRLHYHGVEKDLFDGPCTNPYPQRGPHVIYVGKHYFDADFVQRAKRLFPTWTFHVFGAVGQLTTTGNLICYGERPFAELIPYLKHADIGLQSLLYSPGAECFTDSLKMQQYTYCRLPIAAPRFLQNDRPHVFYYEPGNDDSIQQALRAASQYDRRQISTEVVLSWDDIAAKLAVTS